MSLEENFTNKMGMKNYYHYQKLKNSKIFLIICSLTLLVSCMNKKHTFQDYYGTWILETGNDEGVDSLLDMGLIITLRLEENDVLNIWYTIENEKKLMNSGTWKINETEDYADFQIPDNEYGGYINGKLIINESKLNYKTRSADWIFK